MTVKEKIQRAAAAAVLSRMIKYVRKDPDTNLVKLIDKSELFVGNIFPSKNFDSFREGAKDPENIWRQLALRLIDEIDDNVLMNMMLALGLGAGVNGTKTVRANREKYHCNIPWVILLDPTSACNRKCKGCWSAEYGHKQSLTFEEMDRVLTEAKALGTHACLFTGGEPLLRKKDIIRLCEKHRDMAFHAFTNGTLIDEEFCREMLRVGNFFVSISVEGFEEANDGRRGQGHFQKALDAMDLMHSHRIPFGVSICYTSRNYKVVTSDEFLDLLISKGCVFAWYFHYMPVGLNADTSLLLSPDQRAYMKDRVREIRGLTGGKELYCIDFQNDGEFSGGCVAGGRIYCHINAAGDVEPCVFIHYSSANIREKSFLECLQQPLFKLYRQGQPFNGNHLRPCPMLENPDLLPKMVAESGAHSTDLEAPESAEHLCEKCKAYAQCWKPEAEKLWAEDHT